MLSTLRSRLRNDDDGFTLIELMVVVLIIAILIAIAIPTFLGAQDRAKDRSAQSNVRNALTDARAIATDNAGLLDTVTPAALASAEPNITFVAGSATPKAGEVAVLLEGTGTTGKVTLFTVSASGKWFGATTDTTGKVVSCNKQDAMTNVSTAAACTTAGGPATTTTT
jgi:type IV pilus assembly protein PilA